MKCLMNGFGVDDHAEHFVFDVRHASDFAALVEQNLDMIFNGF